MSSYRRSRTAGASYFFTLALADRGEPLLTRHIHHLRGAYQETNRLRPFSTVAICILPDHLHAIWELPTDDADFSTRWAAIKAGFSRLLPPASGLTASKKLKREKGLWQRRFWEHQIRDELDLQRHIDYIHYNPVKHGLVGSAVDWPHSSFHRYVRKGLLTADWGRSSETAGSYGE